MLKSTMGVFKEISGGILAELSLMHFIIYGKTIVIREISFCQAPFQERSAWQRKSQV